MAKKEGKKKEVVITEVKSERKRGRKPKDDMYFGPNQEAAVVRLLTSTDEAERNRIYNEWLRHPFDKMIESIIRRYSLYRKTESFEELHSDTLSFLATKFEKFEHDIGKKAYSYYGTVCKHYILGLLIKDEKRSKQNISYEDMESSIEEDERYSYNLESDDDKPNDLIGSICEEIKKEIVLYETTDSKKKLTDNEYKVANAIIEILDNWETIFANMDDTNKYNKNSFYSTVREYTDLSTKDIRTALRRFKKLYTLLKLDKLND